MESDGGDEETSAGSTPPSAIPGRAAAGAGGAVLASILSATPLSPIAAIVGAATVPVLERIAEWDRQAWQRFGTVVEDGTARAGAEQADFVAWLDADDSHLALMLDILDGARRAADAGVLRGLARALANGYRDEARIDVERLYVAALSEMRPADAQVLRLMVDELNPNDNFGGVLVLSGQNLPAHDLQAGQNSAEYTVEHLGAALPGLAEGMDFIVATLLRIGCVRQGTPRGAFAKPPQYYVATPFGRACIGYLRDT